MNKLIKSLLTPTIIPILFYSCGQNYSQLQNVRSNSEDTTSCTNSNRLLNTKPANRLEGIKLEAFLLKEALKNNSNTAFITLLAKKLGYKDMMKFLKALNKGLRGVSITPMSTYDEINNEMSPTQQSEFLKKNFAQRKIRLTCVNIKVSDTQIKALRNYYIHRQWQRDVNSSDPNSSDNWVLEISYRSRTPFSFIILNTSYSSLYNKIFDEFQREKQKDPKNTVVPQIESLFTEIRQQIEEKGVYGSIKGRGSFLIPKIK